MMVRPNQRRGAVSATLGRVALLLACFATSAAAQSEERFAIDPHLIDRCLAINDETPMACVGRQADACIQRNGNGPNMVVSVCFENEAIFWDGFLNRTYGEVLALARDAQAQDVGHAPGSLTDALRDMQRAWIAYRDATCAHEMARSRPFGSAAGASANICFMRQTARQVFELQSVAQAYRAQEYGR